MYSWSLLILSREIDTERQKGAFGDQLVRVRLTVFRKKNNGLNSKKHFPWPLLHGTESKNLAPIFLSTVIIHKITPRNNVIFKSANFFL